MPGTKLKERSSASPLSMMDAGCTNSCGGLTLDSTARPTRDDAVKKNYPRSADTGPLYSAASAQSSVPVLCVVCVAHPHQSSTHTALGLLKLPLPDWKL